MTDTPTYNKHLASLSAVFILGDSIIVLPYAASGNYAFWGFLVASVAAIILFFAVKPLASLLFSYKRKSTGVKTAAAIVGVIVSVYTFYSAGLVIIRYMKFVDKILLTDTKRFFVAVIFIAVVALLTTRRQEVVLKLSLIFFVVSVITVLTFFLLNFKDFKLENIAVYRMSTLRELFGEAKPYLFSVSLPALLLPVYAALFTGKSHTGACFAGIVFGITLIALCLLDCLLLFGAPLAAHLDFPLSAAVSTVTVGPLFTRMDGVVYSLYFMTSLIKSTFCLKLCYHSLKSISGHFYVTDEQSENKIINN